MKSLKLTWALACLAFEGVFLFRLGTFTTISVSTVELVERVLTLTSTIEIILSGSLSS